MMTHRLEQVSGQLQREISNIFLFKVTNPVLRRVTITGVRVSPDLKEAKVYYDFSGTDEERLLLKSAFDKVKGYVRRELAQLVHVKYVPTLYFYFDETRELYEKNEAVFKRIHTS
jgi:ribosome-binding factor A